MFYSCWVSQFSIAYLPIIFTDLQIYKLLLILKQIKTSTGYL